MDNKTAGGSFLFKPYRWLINVWGRTRTRIAVQGRLQGLAVLVGIIAGLGAVFFALACHLAVHFALTAGAGYEPPTPPTGEATPGWLPHFTGDLNLWMLILIPTLGGIVSGILVFTLAPEAEGHGTDAVIGAYHRPQGRIRPRVPLVKIFASAITIGSGGSGGREGPIAQIGAGFGSWLSELLRLSASDRRILIAAGMGAGVAAIFRAPLAGALFAAEVLYRSAEFESDVIIPAGLASVVSYCTFGAIFGHWGSLFSIHPDLRFSNPWELGPYLILAIFMTLMATLYIRSFYGVTALFKRMPLARHFRPAVGAFLTAIVGVSLYLLLDRNPYALNVMSFGYGILQGTLDQHLNVTIPALVLLAVAFGKILTTSLTIGSGGSGGVFGPSMVIGGCAGGALGLLLKQSWPGPVPPVGSFVIVGMAGFFAAAAKTPFSTLIIVSEMTGDYRLILPALWVCSVAFLLSGERSLYSSQVEGRTRSPAHRGRFVRETLASETVSQFVDPDWRGPTLHPEDSVSVLIERFQEPDTSVLPVVDDQRRLVGVVSVEEVCLVLQAVHSKQLLRVADLMRDHVKPVLPTTRLDEALELFTANDLVALPVIDGPRQMVIGMIRRFEVASAYLSHMHGPKSLIIVPDQPQAQGDSHLLLPP